MKNSQKLKKAIYDKTQGHCHLCHKKLSLKNYGQKNAKGACQIEHSKPRAKGGTNHINNLFMSCPSCNQAKGIKSAPSVRKKLGQARVPYSKQRAEKERHKYVVAGVAIGGVIGCLVNGERGLLAGAAIGGVSGYSLSPRK